MDMVVEEEGPRSRTRVGRIGSLRDCPQLCFVRHWFNAALAKERHWIDREVLATGEPKPMLLKAERDGGRRVASVFGG